MQAKSDAVVHCSVENRTCQNRRSRDQIYVRQIDDRRGSWVGNYDTQNKNGEEGTSLSLGSHTCYLRKWRAGSVRRFNCGAGIHLKGIRGDGP